MLDWWQKSKPFVYGDLAKNEEDICFYPYLDASGDFALTCYHSDEHTIDLINDLREGLEFSSKRIKQKKKETQDCWLSSLAYAIGITPYRENNQVLQEGLVELNSLYPEMVSEILTGVADYFKNRPCRYDSDIKYRDRVLEFIDRVQKQQG